MNTGTQSVSEVLLQGTARYQKQTPVSQAGLIAKVPVSETPKVEKYTIKPMAKSWEELEKILAQVINFEGVWARARELYDQGYGAELETLAGIAQEIHRNKYPYQLFAASISKAKGNWETITLKVVHDTWEVRQNADTVMQKLALKAESFKAILSLAWKLKGTIMRYLGLATEGGQGIKNPAGYFLTIAKRNMPATAAT